MSDSEAAEGAVVLRYRADGDYFMGVPARDLTSDDLALIAQAGRLGKTKPTVLKRLVESGLYAEVSASTDAARKSAAPAADREAN